MHNMAFPVWWTILIGWSKTYGGNSDDEWESSWQSNNYGSWQTGDDSRDGSTPSPWTSSSSSWQTPSSSSTQLDPPACPSSPLSWSHAEYVAWMSAAWDEEVSFAAQLQAWEEEFEDTENIVSLSVPPPENLPLPSWSSLATMEAQASNHTVMKKDWLDDVMDKRILRGGRRLGCVPVPDFKPPSVDTPASTSSLPSPARRTMTLSNTPSSSSACLPSSSGSSASSSCALPLSSTLISSPWASSSSSPSLDNIADDDEGLTRRWGVVRPGRDRWHNLDGTIKRNTLTPVPEDQPDNNAAPFEPVGVGQHGTESKVKVVSFYDDMFDARVDREGLPFLGDETSTTAGEDYEEGQDVEEETDDTASSSDPGAPPPTPGFWHHGVWVDRPRTREEYRRHVGGRGMRRTLKKEARMASYFNGDWKPKWLRDYIAQKAERESFGSSPDQVLAAGELSPEDPPAVPGEPPCECPPSVPALDTAGDSTPGPNPWAHLGWWSQDEWNAWWKQNGVDQPSSTSLPGTTSSTTSSMVTGGGGTTSTCTRRFEPFFDCARDEFLVQYALALQSDDHTWEEFAVLHVLVLVLPDGLPAVLT